MKKPSATTQPVAPDSPATKKRRIDSRRKGAEWERELARLYRLAIGDELAAQRQGGWQASGGGDGADVKVAPRQLLPPIWNEAKVGNTATRSPLAALRQAQDAMAESVKRNGPALDAVAVAVCKPDRVQPFVVLTLDDWLRLVRRLATGRTDDGVPKD